MATKAQIETGEFLDQFESFTARLNGGATGWLHDLRVAAMEQFSEKGLPSTKQEAWRYTNVKSIVGKHYELPDANADVVDVQRLSQMAFGSLDAHQLVVVNGIFREDLSSLGQLPDGVVIGGLADAIRDRGDTVRAHLGTQITADEAGFAALNTAFVQDGIYIEVGRNVVLEQPIHILFIAAGDATAMVSHPRCLVVADTGSSATILETYVSEGAQHYLNNVMAEFCIGENARVEHLRVQIEAETAHHIVDTRVEVKRSASFNSHVLSLGGALARTEFKVSLVGEGAECLLNGAYLAGGSQHADVTTLIEHAVPHCTSRELYKGVLDGNATSIFNGYVLVKEGALKTDASQQNRNLVLSKRATANTRPQLEIYADDVKCAHGATVGQLDEDQLFYFRSRGISLEEARRELMIAFASEAIQTVKDDSVRQAMLEATRARLNTFRPQE